MKALLIKKKEKPPNYEAIDRASHRKRREKGE